MNIQVELEVESAQFSGSIIGERASVTLGSDEIGVSLVGDVATLRRTLMEMLDVLDTLTAEEATHDRS